MDTAEQGDLLSWRPRRRKKRQAPRLHRRRLWVSVLLTIRVTPSPNFDG